MSAWRQQETQAASLVSSEGELVLLRVAVDPRSLEDLLEALAQLDFPVNPELHHHGPQVVVEFPAYARRVGEVRRILQAYRFDPDSLEKTLVLAAGV